MRPIVKILMVFYHFGVQFVEIYPKEQKILTVYKVFHCLSRMLEIALFLMVFYVLPKVQNDIAQ